MRWLHPCLLGLLLVLSTGCQKKDSQTGSPGPPEVLVDHPVERQVTDYEYFTGRTEAPESVEIRARVTGYITEINFEAGDEVKKGQVLFQIDPRPYSAQLGISKGQLALDEAQLKLAKADLAIGQEVAKTPGAISQQKLNQLEAEVGKATAAVQATTAKVTYDQLYLDFTKVTADIKGKSAIASRWYYSIGNLVSQDMTVLTNLVSQDPMWAYFQVDERTMLRIQQLIREGKVKLNDKSRAPVQIGLANEEGRYPHEGAIDFVNNQVDKSTGTITVRGEFANPEPATGGPRFLKPGLFIRAQVPIGPPHQALVLPESAIGTDQGNKFLYVVNDQNVVENRPITLGQQQSGGMRVVIPVQVVRTHDGVRPAVEGETGEPSITKTDRVIISGLQRVRSGLTVTPKPPNLGSATAKK